MEIIFDKQNLLILSAICQSGDRGITWGRLQRRFGESANPYFLMNLSSAGYTATKDQNGQWINFPEERPFTVKPGFRSVATDRGRAYLEERDYSFRRWLIPTLTSIVALVISIISLVLSVLRG